MKNMQLKSGKSYFAEKFKIGAVFNVESMVPQNGTYVCVPCGYKKELKAGECFPLCFSCLEGKKYNNDHYMKGLGLWELLEAK